MSEARVKRAIATFALERLEEAERKAAALDRLERAFSEPTMRAGVYSDGRIWLDNGYKVVAEFSLLEAVEAMEEP